MGNRGDARRSIAEGPDKLSHVALSSSHRMPPPARVARCRLCRRFSGGACGGTRHERADVHTQRCGAQPARPATLTVKLWR